MALFPGVQGDMYFKGKTHTGLVVSEGNAPSEKYLVSKAETVKFNYMYGPEGNQNVVIAKGKAVDPSASEWDYETSRNVPTIKTAAAGSTNVLGINHHNLYEVLRGRFSGNQPTIITRQYIELPLFEHGTLATANTMAANMKFGAVYGTSGALIHGDYVKVGDNGNLTKFVVGTDNPLAVVGQVWAVEKELPPAGLLAYFLDTKIEELEAFMKAASYAPSPGTNGTAAPSYPTQWNAPGGSSGDAGAFPQGYPWQLHGWLPDFEKLINPVINRGIPFLTDGYFKAKTTVSSISMDDIYNATTNNDGQIEAVAFSGSLKYGSYDAGTDVWTDGADQKVVTASVKTDADTRNNALFVKLRVVIDRVEENPITVKYTDAADAVKTFSSKDVHIDWTNNTIVVYLEPNTVYRDIHLADAKLIVDPVAGVPTEWDYAGSVGAVRILLKK